VRGLSKRDGQGNMFDAERSTTAYVQ